VSQSNDTIRKILIVAVSLSIVFSVLVSASAVLLRPMQEKNKALSIRSNMIAAAGMVSSGASTEKVSDAFEQFEVLVVEMGTGEVVPPETVNAESAEAYDDRAASRDPSLSRSLESDPAGINRLAKYRKAYILREGEEVSKVVLPVHGYGLWSTMYGFLALEGDANTVEGIRFYEHAETPGLGGEIENPEWTAKWEGKKVYEDGAWTDPAFALVKGGVGEDTDNREHKVDALSGATLTSRGVGNTISFWLGDRGYGPFLKKVRQGEI